MDLIEKIIIERSSILPGIVEKLRSTKANHVVLTIEEGSDIGSSLVSLKLLMEKAIELSKVLIVTSSDPTCQSSTQSAGILFKPSVEEITPEDWIKADTLLHSIIPPKSAPVTQDDQADTSTVKSTEESETIPQAPIATPVPSSPNIKTVGSFSMAVGGDIQKYTGSQMNQPDIPTMTQAPTTTQENAFVNRDWTKLKTSTTQPIAVSTGNLQQTGLLKPPLKNLYERTGGIKKRFAALIPQASPIIANFVRNKMLWLGLIMCLLIGGGWFFYYYTFVPMIDIHLYPKNIEVSYLGQITAKNTAYGSSSTENLVISSKVETQSNITTTKSGAATQTSEVGDYATGNVTVYNTTSNPVNLPAGTILISSNLNFKTNTDITVPAQTEVTNELGSTITKGSKIVAVTAVSFGSQYNLDAGATFTVTGYSITDLYGQSFAAFMGGTKREVTTVGEQDVLDIGTAAETELKQQIEQRFRDMHSSDQWILVEESIKYEDQAEGVERFQTDVPIDSENTIVNVTVKLTATALYYNKNEFDALVEELLKKNYEEQVAQGNFGDIINATLDKNITIDGPTVEEVQDKDIVFSFSANGIMHTNLDKLKIQNDLKNKSWDDGLEYINSLPSMEKPAEVNFKPSNYPENLKHFPAYINKINIYVDEGT